MSGDGLVWREPSGRDGGTFARSSTNWSCGNVGFWRFSARHDTDRARGDRPPASSDPVGSTHMPHHPSAGTRRDATAALARAGNVGSDPLQARRSSRHSTRRAGTKACGSIVSRCSRSVARPFRSRAVWSGSSMRTPGSSFSSRATATSSTAWSAPGTAVRASGFAGEPSTRGGERRGSSLSQRHRRQVVLKRRIQLLEQTTESQASSDARTWTSVRPCTRRYAPDDFAGGDIACHDRARADQRTRADRGRRRARPHPSRSTRRARRPSRRSSQSAVVCKSPSAVVARGRLSLTNMTP